MAWESLRIKAKTYIVCCNSYLTPQLLFASNIRPKPLGRWLTEQPMAFCQIVLRQEIVDGVASDPRFKDRVAAYRKEHPEDPIPMPEGDPEPQGWIPVSEERPWHCQIHRDAFHYGDIGPNVDNRLVVDLRWFGIVEPREEYHGLLDSHTDVFGMPQPTLAWVLHGDDRRKQHRMMGDMLRAAVALGGSCPAPFRNSWRPACRCT